ncbi:acyl-CoA Delta-9 desaturase-like [Vanessa cardui]|uniref:acyl-CoA Delta-9 desaturase-like n=1 Tax=Vanessa cardui TaxID=171605 RepID=UPI001F12F22B|nr:acyl-CoA Delta-9 desaturase-like [Vanessa cardui]XP_046962395.1 acyl-CoA Delta-9 desaturase-like [Vanessa cardui]XP_046962396.1 acyl-CoA Delta-9 desaturase-like [Vanessa cardui]XP_046962397.1 acyl-CoA Delta-9 desaturase-like [Vanessa cardui]XP_046962398.1 acyl-CoA Delta-9 desaturase-like [Vanessa cardui]XP_046962399.1 acyl-CoA Delta-9 desaturase-like [Vanessa cardui]
MPPQGQQTGSWVLFESDLNKDATTPIVPPSAEKRKWEIVWRNVILFVLLHIGGVYGAYLFLTKAMWTTRLFAVVLYLCSGLGITAGAHRLWAHKSYKAKLPLRILLTIFNTIAFQDSVLDWARDHRMHHKYSETDADPHNATRGFFFSHVGWLLVRKHREIKEKGHTIDMSDLRADPVLRFQKKYYLILMPLACFILPSIIPTLWGESLWNGYFVCAIFRYVYVLNVTWLVNSAAHKWGSKPYDKNINPVETKSVSLVVLGEGFHNYHHTFPWDYKTAELGEYSLNLSKLFIDAMSVIGWAYDLKTVSSDVIMKRVKRTGDGSHKEWGYEELNDSSQTKVSQD